MTFRPPRNRDEIPPWEPGIRSPAIDGAALWHRLQFAFTITYHYLFPQLTMGLAFTYFAFILRHYRGKVRPAEDTQGFS